MNIKYNVFADYGYTKELLDTFDTEEEALVFKVDCEEEDKEAAAHGLPIGEIHYSVEAEVLNSDD